MDQKRMFEPHSITGTAEWTGGRTWDVQGEITNVVKGTIPPSMGGEPDKWSPEDFYLAGINTCQMAVFTSIANRIGIDLVAYKSNIEGHLDYAGETFAFIDVVVKPEVVVRTEEDKVKAMRAMEQAKKLCIVSNSCSSNIRVEAQYFVAGEG